MIVNVLCAVVVGVSGWAIGRAGPAINLPVVVLTLFAAVTAHSAMQWAFLEGRMDVVLGDPRRDAPAAVVVLIATASGWSGRSSASCILAIGTRTFCFGC